MAFGDDFLKGFFGSDYLKDYTHASKTFRSNGYELAPRHKYLFYVRLNLNTVGIPPLAAVLDNNDINNIGLLCKTVNLPSYAFEVDTMNQYNRKRLVQTDIKYQPVSLTFHDDGGDLIRNVWYNYFSYYFKDPTYGYGNPAVTNGTSGQLGNESGAKADYNGRDTYDNNRDNNDWGFIGESYTDGTGAIPGSGKPRFFNDITIYGFDQHKWVSYVLINPVISDWKHDTYSYSESNGTMEHTMTIEYETVKYYNGTLTGQNPDGMVKGFADPSHYDTTVSPLARVGSTGSILGPGGVMDAVGNIYGSISDLANGKGSVSSVLGAVQAAGRTYETFKGKDLRSIIKEEGQTVLKDVIRNDLPGATQQAINSADGFFFPKTPDASTNVPLQPNTPKSATESPTGPKTVRNFSRGIIT